MQLSNLLFALSAVVGALAAPTEIVKRNTADDFVNGGCKGVVMIYARGSTEAGNVVCRPSMCFIIIFC